MKWKLKRCLKVISLTLCLKGQKNQYGLFLSKTLLQGRSLCKKAKGASEIGLIIFSFYFIIFIMFPMHLSIQELNFYRAFNNKVQLATEMACFELIYHLNSDSYSMGTLVEGPHHKQLLENAIVQLTGEEIEVSNLSVNLSLSGQFFSYKVSFDYPYEMRFILKHLLTKIVSIEFAYEIPIDR